MKLYDEMKVAEIESTSEFTAAQAVARKRSQQRKASSERERANTLEWAENLPSLEIPHLSKGELRRAARKHYDSLWASRATSIDALMQTPE